MADFVSVVVVVVVRTLPGPYLILLVSVLCAFSVQSLKPERRRTITVSMSFSSQYTLSLESSSN